MIAVTRLSLSPRWRLVAAAVVALIVIQLVRNALDPSGIDFISYWAAARFVLAGTPALAYDIAAHHALEVQAASVDGLMSFPYPPPFFIFIAPFGLLPFPAGAMAWAAFSLSAFALAVRRFMPGAVGLALAFPPVLVCGIIGQNGLLSAAVMIAALGLLDRRPFAAGLLFSVLAIKPQLAAAVPVLLIASRNWRAVSGALLGGGTLYAVSLALYGIEAWRGFFAILPFYGQIATQGGVDWHRVGSVYAALRLLGFAAAPAAVLHGACAIAALWLLWRTGRDPSLVHARGAALVTATMLLSPYVYMYDQVMLVAAIVWAMRQGCGEQLALRFHLLSLLAFVLMLAALPGMNVIPLTPLALLCLVYRETGIGWRVQKLKLVPAAGIEPAAP